MAKYVKQSEVLKLLPISENTLHKYLKEGKIKAIRLGIKGHYLYDIEPFEKGTFGKIEGNEENCSKEK